MKIERKTPSLLQTSYMKTTLILSLLIFLAGCGTTSRIEKKHNFLDRNKDVYLLSILIRDHLKITDSRTFDLSDLQNSDSINRISSNFSHLEFELHGGYISVEYRFSEHRNLNFELNDYELRQFDGIGWKLKDMDHPYDEKIKFDYGEDLYRIKKILVNKNQ